MNLDSLKREFPSSLSVAAPDGSKLSEILCFSSSSSTFPRSYNVYLSLHSSIESFKRAYASLRRPR